MNIQTRNKQGGFTLVEIAIVLVIIGLLLGGVLKGQELIENSKVKNAAQDFNGVTAAFNSYVDRFRQMPGDDGPLATLTARGTNWTSITTASAPAPDGVIANALGVTFTGAGEGLGFWQHLRAAGFLTGDPKLTGAAALPRNAFGGLIGITNGSPSALPGNAVCMSQVPGKAARALDTQLDDGVPGAGMLRATVGAAGANTAPAAAALPVATLYVDETIYTVCRTL